MDAIRYGVTENIEPGAGITPVLWSTPGDAAEDWAIGEDPDATVAVAFRPVDADPDDDWPDLLGYAAIQFIDTCEDGRAAQGAGCTDMEGACEAAEQWNLECPHGCDCWTPVSVWQVS